MKLISLNIGLPRTLGRTDVRDAMDEAWTTGYFKEPVAGPVWLGRTNLAGDGQANLQFHGGLEKAENGYPEEHFAYWQVAFGMAGPGRGTVTGPMPAPLGPLAGEPIAPCGDRRIGGYRDPTGSDA